MKLEAVIIGVDFIMLPAQCLPGDHRHRLDVSKMTPSRVYTPAGSVSRRGTAISVYTQDSPGGYMPCGLSTPGVDMYSYKAGFPAERTWMFEDMDVITFYEESADDYDARMAECAAGHYKCEFPNTTFDLQKHNGFLRTAAEEAKNLHEHRLAAREQMAILDKQSFKKWTGNRKASRDDGADGYVLLCILLQEMRSQHSVRRIAFSRP